MNAPHDAELLQRLRLARADIVTAMGTHERPPHPSTLRCLAELQLSIMAIEATMADKADARFLARFHEEAA